MVSSCSCWKCHFMINLLKTCALMACVTWFQWLLIASLAAQLHALHHEMQSQGSIPKWFIVMFPNDILLCKSFSILSLVTNFMWRNSVCFVYSPILLYSSVSHSTSFCDLAMTSNLCVSTSAHIVSTVSLNHRISLSRLNAYPFQSLQVLLSSLSLPRPPLSAWWDVPLLGVTVIDLCSCPAIFCWCDWWFVATIIVGLFLW
jgi:hypothetical protein